LRLTLGDIALGVGLLLLGFALFLKTIVASDRAYGFLGLALDVFDDALDASLGTGLTHVYKLLV
jgi:hypothetical protein